MPKKKTAAATTKKQTTKAAPVKREAPAPKEVTASENVAVNDAPAPAATPATESAARKSENRNVVMANTAEGFKETPQSAETPPATPAEAPKAETEEPADGCRNLRPNGETCLDEYKRARETPEAFTDDQKTAIYRLKNLCEYCIEQFEGE